MKKFTKSISQPGTAVKSQPRAWRQAARRVAAMILPRRRFLVQGPASSRQVCLTFDDGPHPEHTPELLDVLKAHEVSATFFVIGRRVERYPELVRRMAAEGHAVGGHSYDHGRPDQVSAAQLVDEVHRTSALLTPLIGFSPRLFRPPQGKLTISKLWSLWRADQAIILWNVDPKDYRGRTVDEVRTRLLARPPRGGDLVLLHDDQPYAAGLLPDLIAAVRGAGLEFVTVSSWVEPSPGPTVLNRVQASPRLLIDHERPHDSLFRQ
jgi:peptidoglycan/xylan/chitin deacetylase (PgdA/CDA1 family)